MEPTIWLCNQNFHVFVKMVSHNPSPAPSLISYVIPLSNVQQEAIIEAACISDFTNEWNLFPSWTFKRGQCVNDSFNLSAPLGQKENSPTKIWHFFSILLWRLFVVLIACLSICVLPSFRKLKTAGGFIKNFTMKFSFLQLQNAIRINTALLFLCQVSHQKQIFSSMSLCQKSLLLF